jgi:hypothetical protein
MKMLTAAAIAAALLAGPVFAQSSTDFAIMHFNMDADSAGDIRMSPSNAPMMVDLGEDTTLAQVLAHFNMDANSAGDLRGQQGVTIIMSDPTYAAEIFARLRAESLMDE